MSAAYSSLWRQHRQPPPCSSSPWRHSEMPLLLATPPPSWKNKKEIRKILHTRHTTLVGICFFWPTWEKPYILPIKRKTKTNKQRKKKPTTVGVTLSLSFGGQTATLVAGDLSCCWPLLQGWGLTLFEFSNHEHRVMGKRHPSHPV